MARDKVSPVAHVSVNVPAIGITTTFASQPQAGALCAVRVWAFNPGAVTVTDSAGNVYTQDVVGALNALAPSVFIFRSDNIVSVPSLAVTIKAANAGNAVVGFAQTYTNTSGAPEDSGAYSGTDNITCHAGPRGFSNNDAYVAVMGCDGSLAANNLLTETDTGPWVTQGVEQNGVLYDNGIGSDLLGSAQQKCEWLFQASGSNWNAAIAAYKDPVSGVRLWWA